MTETVPTARALAHPVSPREAVQAYLQGWNDHDGAAVAASFAPDGTYTDPTLPGPLPGPAVAGYVAALVAGFPDLHFTTEALAVDGDRITAQWRMQGTNTGPLPGAPAPTGGTCDLPGVDVITVGADGIRSVAGYFDQKTFMEQLGLQAVVVPADEWPVHFGMSLRTELGRTDEPGALTMTWIDVRNAEEEAQVSHYGQGVVERLASEPGFLGVVVTSSDRRMHTVAAWTSPEAAEAAIARNPVHREGVDRVNNHGLGERGYTGIWMPWRLNDQTQACPGCRARVHLPSGAATARCACGGVVEVSSYF